MNSEEIQRFAKALKEGKTLLYPTDTVWGIGCDATNSEAVSQVYSIKQREESKSLIILVDSFEMLAKYVKFIPEKAPVKTYRSDFQKNEAKPFCFFNSCFIFSTKQLLFLQL